MVEVASANVVTLTRAKEVTYGVPPTANTDYTKARYTGESFSPDLQTVASNEINDDRQTSDLIQVDASAGGSLNFEFSHATYDPELIALYHSDTADYTAGVQTTVNTVNITGGNTISGDWSSLSSHVGKWVEVTVKTGATVNQRKVVKLASANGTTATISYGTLTNVTGKDVTIAVGKFISNGVTRQSFSYQRHFRDAENGAGNFAVNSGMSPNNMSLSVSAGAIVTGSFDFVGKQETAATTSVFSGNANAATTTKIFNGVTSVEAILEGGVTFRLVRMDLTIGNNIEAQKAVGVLGALELTSGQIAVSGTIQAYFNTKAQFDKLLAFTDTDLVLVFRDQDNNIYAFEFPKVKFTAGRRNATGINQPVLAELSFGAIKDPTLGKTMRLFSIKTT